MFPTLMVGAQYIAPLRRVGIIFCLALLTYSLMAGQFLTKQSIAPHFAYLAGAWLEGHSNLNEPLPSTYDLIRYNNLWYVAQPPLPALLMLPITALRGAAGTPEILLSVLLGAVSVALCDLTLAQFVPTLPQRRRGWLTLFFALGTAHGYMSALGTVWFMGQIAAVLFLWVFLLGMQWRLPWLAGIGLGAVALARPTVVLGALVLYVGWQFYSSPPRESVGARHVSPLYWRNVVLFALPLLLCLGFLGWYNQARFGAPTDFGYAHVVDAPNIRERRLEQGSFSPAFLPDNLYTATLRPPLLKDGTIEPDPWGMGLLWISPVLLYGLWAGEPQKWLFAGAFGFIMLFPLLYHNSGSVQFGYRFVLDGLPLWMLLVAQGAKKGAEKGLILLTLWSVIAHLWGFAWIYEIITGSAWGL